MDNENKLALIEEKEWFNKFIEDCQGIVVQIKNTGWDLVVLYHKLGKRILDEKDKFWAEGISAEDVLKIVSEQVNRSVPTLYIATQFYQKYPELESSPYTEETNWWQIVKDLKKLDVPKQQENKEDKKEAASPTQTEQAKKNELPALPDIKWNWNVELKQYQILMPPEVIETIDWSKVKDDLLDWLNGLE